MPINGSHPSPLFVQHHAFSATDHPVVSSQGLRMHANGARVVEVEVLVVVIVVVVAVVVVIVTVSVDVVVHALFLCAQHHDTLFADHTCCQFSKPWKQSKGKVLEVVLQPLPAFAQHHSIFDSDQPNFHIA